MAKRKRKMIGDPLRKFKQDEYDAEIDMDALNDEQKLLLRAINES